MKFIVQCAWCKRIIAIKELSEEEMPALPITHSICQQCLKKLNETTQEIDRNQYNNIEKGR